jgi:hypothetical protein
MINLVIASPLDGLPESASVAWAYAWALAKALQDPAVRMLDPVHMCYPADVCRARSRAVYQFLQKTDGTHLLWWDTDNAPADSAARVIKAMLDTCHDWVGCPYPRKRLHWDRMAMASKDGQPIEAHAVDYAFRVNGPDGTTREVEVKDGCVQVDRLGMGFTITSRNALQRMWDHYFDELWFTDVVDAAHYPGVALFDTMLCAPVEFPPGSGQMMREWLSEDYAGCERFKRIGGKPMMYVGEGSPVDHVGGFRYRGNRDGLVYAR